MRFILAGSLSDASGSPWALLDLLLIFLDVLLFLVLLLFALHLADGRADLPFHALVPSSLLCARSLKSVCCFIVDSAAICALLNIDALSLAASSPAMMTGLCGNLTCSAFATASRLPLSKAATVA